MLSEFDIIRTCFEQEGLAAIPGDSVIQGIGDDCALIKVPANKMLAFSMDTLVEDIHFPATAAPGLVASRALAVNLSDLAATGAKPLVFTLGLTIPEANQPWLEAFAAGLKAMAKEFNCYLIGGDISRGALTITIQVQGLVDDGQAILRSGACPGDRIYITESLGCAALALLMFEGKLNDVLPEEHEIINLAFYRPQPRIDAALTVAGLVSAGIDISDGLLADLGHICEQSKCSATLNLTQIPLHPLVEKHLGRAAGLSKALSAGDDYELILTVSAAQESLFLDAVSVLPEKFTCIGEITEHNEAHKVSCIDENGSMVSSTRADAGGYMHFQGDD
jgi:thiamine-monophosphate kinase